MIRVRLGPVLLVVAAVVAVVGTFLQLHVLHITFTGGDDVHSTSSWEYAHIDGSNPDGAFPPRYGLPISVASVVAVLGAVLLLRGRESGRLLAVGGVAGMTAAVWAAAESYLSMAGAVGDPQQGVDFGTSVDMGEGLLVMITGVVVGAVGLVFVLRRKRDPEAVPEGPVVIHQLDDSDELDTPPYGVPMQENA